MKIINLCLLFTMAGTLVSMADAPADLNSNNLPKNQVIAHRGYWNREGGRQNDLQGYKEAIKIGVFGAETDVRMTRDSVLVLCHDPYYNQDTTLVVLQRNFDELDSITRFDDFLDLINATPGFTFVVECKGAPVPEIVKAMDRKNIDYDNRIIFFSFKSDECEELIAMDRGFKVAYLNGTYTPEELKEKGYWGAAYNQAKFLKEGADYVARMKDLGLTTLAWTVNKPENMHALLELGVDYIITDWPK